jgi:signal peptidase
VVIVPAGPSGLAGSPSSEPTRRLRRATFAVTALVTRLFLAGAVLLVAATCGIDMGQHFGGYRTYTILSGSMSPGMPVGSLAFSAPVPTSDLRVGDVVTFHPPNRGDLLVTHRVWKVLPNSTDLATGRTGAALVTKGDANSTPDPWRIPVAGTAMKRMASVPLLGYGMHQLQTRGVRVALVLMPITAFGIILLVEIWRPKRSNSPSQPPLRSPRRRRQGRLSRRYLAAIVGMVGALLSIDPALALFTSATATPGNAFSTLTVAAPTLNSAAPQAAGSIALAWSASPTASIRPVTYLVFRAPAGSGTFTQVTGSPVSGLSYADTPPSDVSYDYKVQTVAATFSSPYSNVLTALPDRTAPTIGAWAVCDQDGIILPASPNWIKSVATYIVYANATDPDALGVATVTATTGIVGGATTSFSLSATAGTCAGVVYAYTSTVRTGPALTGSETFFADVIASDAAGNVTHTNIGQSANVGVDVLAPGLVVLSSTHALLSSVITLDWTASVETGSGLAGYQLRVFNAGTTTPATQYPNPVVVSGTTLTFPFSLTFLSTYDFVATPVDNAGNNGPAATLNGVLNGP